MNKEEIDLKLRLRFKDDWWVLECEEMPGLYIANPDLAKVMHAFVPGWVKLVALDSAHKDSREIDTAEFIASVRAMLAASVGPRGNNKA